jgi:hypothetical protein
MTRKPHRLTPALQQAIAAYIRAGGFEHVAAEAAGVPRRVFDKWLHAGQRKEGRKVYRRFVAAVRQAGAQARLGAEIAVLKAKPLDWLKCGPGKERPGNPGWSTAARAQSRGNETHPLMLPEMQRLVATLLGALSPYPEARMVAVRALDDQVPGKPGQPRTPPATTEGSPPAAD